MTEPKTPPSLDDLDARLRAARLASGVEDKAVGDGTAGAGGERGALGLAVRVGVELVSALIVGSALGYGLDLWLGTKPWLMVVFFFLGAAAGISNVWRVVNGMSSAVGYAGDKDEKPPKTGPGL
ncbi:MAG: AtpZ/AtpI family protein [Alphaproteobacteria bacterium]|nr:AtpZ/AtpI family protein [Alphaproteobacteria bacterium]